MTLNSAKFSEINEKRRPEIWANDRCPKRTFFPCWNFPKIAEDGCEMWDPRENGVSDLDTKGSSEFSRLESTLKGLNGDSPHAVSRLRSSWGFASWFHPLANPRNALTGDDRLVSLSFIIFFYKFLIPFFHINCSPMKTQRERAMIIFQDRFMVCWIIQWMTSGGVW